MRQAAKAVLSAGVFIASGAFAESAERPNQDLFSFYFMWPTEFQPPSQSEPAPRKQIAKRREALRREAEQFHPQACSAYASLACPGTIILGVGF